MGQDRREEDRAGWGRTGEKRTGQGGAGKGMDIGENMTKHRNRRKSECRAENSR